MKFRFSVETAAGSLALQTPDNGGLFMGLIAKLDVAAALNVAAVCAALAFMGAIVAGFI
jgi:hypothetical protein